MNRDQHNQLMCDMSQRILDSVDPGTVAVLAAFDGVMSIFQFGRHELEDARMIFGPYFELCGFARSGWEPVFRAAFEEAVPARHISTVLITETAVENGAVFRYEDVN